MSRLPLRAPILTPSLRSDSKRRILIRNLGRIGDRLVARFEPVRRQVLAAGSPARDWGKRIMMIARDRTRGGPVDGPAHAPASVGGVSGRRNFISFDRLNSPSLEAGAAATGRAPLERAQFSQSAIDIAALISGAVVGFLTAAAIVASIFILFFVRT